MWVFCRYNLDYAPHAPGLEEIVAMVDEFLKKENRTDLLKPEHMRKNSLYAHFAGDMEFLTVGVFYFFFVWRLF